MLMTLRSLAFVFVAVATTSALADDVGIRVRFGLNDEKSTKWDGTVETSAGRVMHLSGWRFGKGDTIDGVKGWTTSTRPLAQQGRSNNQKKGAAAAAKRQQAQAKQPMTDNGVIVSMTDVNDETRVTIKTAQ